MTLQNYIIESKDLKSMLELIKNSIDDCEEPIIAHCYNKIVSTQYEPEIRSFLETKFSKKETETIDEIIDHAIKFNAIEHLYELAKTPDIYSITENDLLSGNDIKILINSHLSEFPQPFINWIINYRPIKGGKGVGAYETALVLFLNGAYSAGKGDINIGNTEIELKGKGAHAVGQAGFGKGNLVFNQLVKNLKAKRIQFIADKDQLYAKKGNTWFESLIENNKNSKDIDIILDAYADALTELYNDLSATEIRDALNTLDIFNVNSKLPLDKQKMVDCLGALDLTYYHMKTKFDMIMFVGASAKARATKYVIIDGRNIGNDLSNIRSVYDTVSTKLQCDIPNTKKAATAQDSFVGFNVR